MDPQIFARMVGGASPTVMLEESPDNILDLNLFYSGGPMVISKKLYFLKSPDKGGGHTF